MQIEGVCGPQFVSDSASSAVRLGKNGALIVSEYHGKYYEAAYRGLEGQEPGIFHATNPGLLALAGPAATATSFALANPLNSGRNLVLHKVRVALTTLPGTLVAGAFALYGNPVPNATAVTGTSITPINGALGAGSKPAGNAFYTATLPVAPSLIIPIGGKISATEFGGISNGLLEEDLDGSLILSPGTYLTVQETVGDTTTNFSAVVSMSWEEVAA